MRAGKLRHRIAIQVNTGVTNAIGEIVPAWTTTATVWGSLEPLSGRELLMAQEISPESTFRSRMRYTAEAIPSRRLLWSGRAFDINHVANFEEKDVELKLLCSEAV